MQYISCFVLACDTGHGVLEVHVFLRQGVQCLYRFLIEVIGFVVRVCVFPVSSVELPFRLLNSRWSSPNRRIVASSSVAAPPVEFPVAFTVTEWSP